MVGIGNDSATGDEDVSPARFVEFVDQLWHQSAVGASEWRIIFRHVAPNCGAPYIIIATATLGGAIITEASLSFLGLGIPPPTPSWGRDLFGSAQKFAELAPWMPIMPGIAISVAVYGFNLFGDALRDILDPRLRGG
ncbi:MAG: ABC transporter permease [Chloroflexi bacterium]|nr:ABC transporter permease [Chloroflexota bacterium]